MKISTRILAAALLFTTGAFAKGVESDIDGATPGKWTMDLDAAKKVAAEKNLPILIDFSGTDWCHWCQVMEENVFEKADWKSYAEKNIMMVLIDFPNDKSLVPEKYVMRNKQLQSDCGIRGFPTFIILASDGETELGRLASGRNKTPESFINELKNLFRNCPAQIAAYCDSLSPEARETFQKLCAEEKAAKTALAKGQKESDAARIKVAKLQKESAEAKKAIAKFRISQLPADSRLKHAALTKELKMAQQELKAWYDTKPARSQETTNKTLEIKKRIADIEQSLLQF